MAQVAVLVVALALVFTVLLAVALRRHVFFMVRVESSSMAPTLRPRDLLLAIPLRREALRRGAVVVFRSSELGMPMVKRVIGLPGDDVELGAGGAVRVNGELLDEPYAVASGTYRGRVVVPPDRCFVLGDNRPLSIDSRSWSEPTIRAGDILGTVRLRLTR